MQLEISKDYDIAARHTDVKNVLRQDGGQAERAATFFGDTQIKDEGNVEDIDNVAAPSQLSGASFVSAKIKRIYGPPIENQYVTKVDGLHSLLEEMYSVQPAIEILPQGLDSIAYSPTG